MSDYRKKKQSEKDALIKALLKMRAKKKSNREIAWQYKKSTQWVNSLIGPECRTHNPRFLTLNGKTMPLVDWEIGRASCRERV